MEAYAIAHPSAPFSSSRGQFEGLVNWLDGPESEAMTHGELEARLDTEGRELLRRLLQDHLDLRAQREVRHEQVVGADGVARRKVEQGHDRALRTVFGQVQVHRMAYRADFVTNLYPADAVLNLPLEKHSHGLRRLAAIESARGSFESAVAALERATGQVLGKKQLELLAQRAAEDFEPFYEQRRRHLSALNDVLVLSFDGKGVVVRTEALREATRRAAEEGLQSSGEHEGRPHKHRLAEIGAVYDCTPVPRTAEDILPRTDEERERAKCRPKARSKWLTASIVEDAATVIADVFDEAERRDPTHRRVWLVLLDGNNHQIERALAEARARGVRVVILLDFIHVLGYLWKAAKDFFDDPHANEADDWVREQATKILNGRSSDVAAAIRRKATCMKLEPDDREGADTCADYLIRKRLFLDYATALERGWPIATGVIEGACRHLVKDRMAITGARWGLQGAEAILKLRALLSNGDFEDYWQFHLEQSRQRVHRARYADGAWPAT